MQARRIDQLVNRPVILQNKTCPYCGAELDPKLWTKDHVVGRRFVPKGMLDQCWNVIVRTCEACNNRKSDLEDDLSAISMQPDPTGRFGRDDEALAAEAKRKGANSISRLTGKPVSTSSETITFDGALGPGFKLSSTATAPPQPDEARVFKLACLQLAGFFYELTYKAEEQRGFFWPGIFLPLLVSMRGDWGNSVHRTFMHMVSSWSPRLVSVTADGYYKVAIRRHPELTMWSWALEWNESLRIVGFFGEEDPVRNIVSGLPKLEMMDLGDHEGARFLVRIEVPLKENDDILFDMSLPKATDDVDLV